MVSRIGRSVDQKRATWDDAGRMSQNSKLVNLDAMILRADFAAQDPVGQRSYDAIPAVGTRDLISDSPLHAILRKPDFQRETSHWTPELVVSLVESFANGDLIPSVILWRSPTYLFVIDGGHRLSALRAWIEDDYGDGPISKKYFGTAISKQQVAAADEVRMRISKGIGSWQHLQAAIKAAASAGSRAPEHFRHIAVTARALQIQWLTGDADKAEQSFFKINTKGAPLDDVEILLLSNRRKPIPIAARAVIRSAEGHRYWSAFSPEHQKSIEALAKELHHTLFEPEVTTPLKTLDLPLGGAKGFRTAIDVLIHFILFANQNQHKIPKSVEEQPDDLTGEETVDVLKKALALANRITRNDRGSLGLHPAIYFYGPTGRHVSYLFLGTAHLIAHKLANNDGHFFRKFTNIREKLEAVLVSHKDLVATILQKTTSFKRVTNYSALLDRIIDRLNRGEDVTAQNLVTDSGLVGKIVVGGEPQYGQNFSDDTKSVAFISTALATALRCPICQGYLDSTKSISYDHIQDKSAGGRGSPENLQLTHPYCNQSVKNQATHRPDGSDKEE